MKKNIRKIPKSVRRKLESLCGQDIVVGGARQFTAEAIRKGDLKHIHVDLRSDGLHYLERVLPLGVTGVFVRKTAV